MKTLHSALLIGALTMLTACGSDKDSSDTSATTGSTATADVAATVTTEDGNMDFMPEDVTISVGDTVRFVMSATHNAVEVSQETYDARAADPLDGGFEVDYGTTGDVTFTEAGVYYYVCAPHVTIDMVGTITVE